MAILSHLRLYVFIFAALVARPLQATDILKNLCYQQSRTADPATANKMLSESITALTNQMVEKNERVLKLPRKGSFNITTYNTGLLNTRVLGVFRAEVPQYEERRDHVVSAIEDHLQTKQPDFLFLQEIWHRADFDSIANVAKEADYIPIGTRG